MEAGRSQRSSKALRTAPSKKFSFFPMKLKIAANALVFGLLLSSSGAFGPEGHKLVGDIAQNRLTPATAAKVSALLDGMALGEAALIPDEIKDWDKGGFDAHEDTWGLPEHKEIENQLHAFWQANNETTDDSPTEQLHRQFHFADIPVKDVEKYADGEAGRSDHDLVQMMKFCVQVLKKEVPENNRYRITRPVAVILLAHYTGDIHQPLHVGAEYFSKAGKKSNPDKGQVGYPDKGGNSLKIGEMTGVKIPDDPKSRFYPQLHGLWDGLMVDEAKRQIRTDAGGGRVDYAKYLAEHEPQNWKPAPGSKPETWSEAWADEIQPISREAHERLDFTGIKTSTRSGVTTASGFASESRRNPNYVQWGGSMIKVELGKAGWRLAELLEQALK